MFLIFPTALLMTVFGWITISLKSKEKPAVFYKALTTTCAVVLAALNANGYEWLIVAGLICGVFGDIFLENSKTFVFGMLSFLVGHVFYSLGFALSFAIPKFWVFSIIYIFLGTLYILFLYKNLGSLRLGVGGYVFAIATMLAFSFGPFYTQADYFKILLPIGAGLFVLSDFYLAYDKFVRALPARHVIVLATYFTAQFLISLSVLF